MSYHSNRSTLVDQENVMALKRSKPEPKKHRIQEGHMTYLSVVFWLLLHLFTFSFLFLSHF